MKKRMILFGGLLVLLLTACGNQSPAENQTEQTLPSELETGVTVETNAPAETIDQNLENLFWEENPQETTSGETQPKQTEKPDTPAPTTPKQDTDTTKPVKPKPTEPTKPSAAPEETTETTEPSDEPEETTQATEPTEKPAEPTQATQPPTEPAQTTEPTQAAAEPTKPSGGSGSGNTSPEWTPPIL